MSYQLAVIDQFITFFDRVAFILASVASVLFFLNLYLKRDFVNKVEISQKIIVVILTLNIIAYAYLSNNIWGQYWAFDPLETFRSLLLVIVLLSTAKFSENTQQSLLCKILFFVQIFVAALLIITPYLLIDVYTY